MTFGSIPTTDLVPSVDSLGPSCGRLGTSGDSLRPSAAGLIVDACPDSSFDGAAVCLPLLAIRVIFIGTWESLREHLT